MDIFLKTTSALNDETRVKLLKFININGKCCVCDLENSFDMIQSRLSRHLKILKEAGFLRVEREGRFQGAREQKLYNLPPLWSIVSLSHAYS